MPNPELVTALDLDKWSDSRNSKSTLPMLVRRLIIATAQVTQISMRAREGVGLPGWDGLVDCDAPDPHVPSGRSGWEIGTSRDSRDKAQSDYRSRVDDPLGVDPTSTTFVFVTSRIWRERDDWRDAKRAEGKWADVRAYDADDLETWLERAPSVHVWISEVLGREPRDVETLDRWWNRCRTQTNPVLPMGSDIRPRGISIQLPDLDRHEATEALMSSAQLSRDVADKHASHARRNLLSLRRTLAMSPAFKRPAWSQGTEGRRLLALVLAGSWDERYNGDRQAIETLTGRPYTDVESDLAAWNALEDAPLRRTGQVWRVASKDDAWDLISSLATGADLDRFHEVAAQVLMQPDPALDVEPERRFMADIVGEPRRYSRRLTSSLADTAAFLGGYVGETELADGTTGQSQADRLVRTVVSARTWLTT